MKQGFFITVEGVEGAGKSTAMKFIEAHLRENDIDVVVTREPGGTEIAEVIRHVLLDHHEEVMAEDTELLLMFASRAQHIVQVIKPNLLKGKTVLCDRFTDASFAYQGGGRCIPEARIAALEAWVLGDFRPDITILLDLPSEIGVSRVRGRGQLDRIETEELAFFNRVRECYLDRAKQYAERYRLINAEQSIAEVKQALLNLFNKEILVRIHERS